MHTGDTFHPHGILRSITIIQKQQNLILQFNSNPQVAFESHTLSVLWLLERHLRISSKFSHISHSHSNRYPHYNGLTFRHIHVPHLHCTLQIHTTHFIMLFVIALLITYIYYLHHWFIRALGGAPCLIIVSPVDSSQNTTYPRYHDNSISRILILCPPPLQRRTSKQSVYQKHAKNVHWRRIVWFDFKYIQRALFI